MYKQIHWALWRWDDRLGRRMDRAGREEPEWLCTAWERAHSLNCWLFRQHEPTPDQCNIPDHDACVFCQKGTPGQALRSA